jgi:uncharacterized protein (UPF0210 family)
MRKWTITIEIDEHMFVQHDYNDIVEEIKDRISDDLPALSEVEIQEISDIYVSSGWSK